MKTHTSKAHSRTEWTDEETRALAHTYSKMLRLESDGLLGPSKAKGQTSKASLVRTFLEQHCPSRTKGSVEAKLMNLSAVRQELGIPLVEGYLPLPNMSDSCRKIGAEVFAQEVSNESIKDCIYVTDPDWINCLQTEGWKGEANFWRKDMRQLALELGSHFYFKERGAWAFLAHGASPDP
jgi:hypothetical protein